MNRRAFALLAVLWTVAVVAMLVFSATLASRETLGASRNRMAGTRARWLVEGCTARARARIDHALTSPSAWQDSLRSVDLGVSRYGCSATLTPAGAALDINTASAGRLGRLFRAAGIENTRADSLVDALLDWEDADDVARPFGAEADWYRAHGLTAPRNGPFADRRELRLVRGFDEDTALLLLFDVERDKTPINLAAIPTITSLPGISEEVLSALIDRRQAGQPIVALPELAYGISREARDTLFAHFPELAEEAIVAPEAWVLEVSARVGRPAIESNIRLRLVFTDQRAAIAARRSW